MQCRLTCCLFVLISLPFSSFLLAQEPTRSTLSTVEKLAAFLKRFPESDADHDGRLTMDKYRNFQQDRRSRTEARRPVSPHADIAYGEHERQRFDLWPVPDAKEPTPLVIFIHGGGFRGGDKSAVSEKQVRLFQEAGVAFASMNYRLSDVGPYPNMMHDAARGLQTIRHRAKEWNIDSNRVACFGGSAGAGISLWLAFHDDLAQPNSDDPVARQSTRILAAATLNGQSTYDMHTYREWFGVPDLPFHDALPAFLGIDGEIELFDKVVRQRMKDASPITHLSRDDRARVYMVYGHGNTEVTRDTPQGDWVHHVRLGLKLQEAMQALGLQCIVRAPGINVENDPDGSVERFLIRQLIEAK
ncbi:alpha/beta hydrolase [Rubripirellula reticaptiva]|uniref:Carboxylesterase NlhH n=1 Tax=Rubripirellula reticaptiva TaxID=2528013 RepID=A0A5C6F9J2_9BACT|nr:alpha/beta hydrolase [Rubripirellula reticaptiva]TWU57117.1 Carboxylesterase NlhH [Rubripirellula reticaptiva]